MGVRFYAKPHLEILTLTEVKLADTNATNYLKFKYNEDASADYYLYWKVNGAARTIDLSGNLTIAGNFVTQNNNVTINAVGAARTLTLNENLTIGDGYNVTITAQDAASSITLDEQTFEVEGEGTATRLFKLKNAGDAARTLTYYENFTIGDGYAGTLTFSASGDTLTVEETSLLNQDLTSDATPTFAGITSNGAVNIGTALAASLYGGFTYGTYATAKTVSAQTANVMPIQVHVDSQTDADTATKYVMAGYFRADATTNTQPDNQLQCIIGRMNADVNLTAAYGIQMHTNRDSGTSTEIASGSFMLDLENGGSTGGLAWGLRSNVKSTGAGATRQAGTIASIFSVTENVVDHNIYAENLSGATATNMLYLHNAGTCTNGIRLLGDYTYDIVLQNSETISNATDGLVSITGDVGLNVAGATGEIGVNFYSISSTYSTICQSDAEGIASSSDLRIGLDETNRTLIICDRGDIATDFGLAESGDPMLYLVDATATHKLYLRHDTSQAQIRSTKGMGIISDAGPMWFRFDADLSSGSAFAFKSIENIELTDADAEQAFMYIEPKINQTSTAGYIGLLMDVTETSTGSGTNALMDLRIATASKFMVDNSGNVGLGEAAFGTSATNVLGITADGTVPSTSPAGMVQIFADDSSGGATNATLAIRTEETVATEALVGDSTLNIWVNGTEYHLLLRAV